MKKITSVEIATGTTGTTNAIVDSLGLIIVDNSIRVLRIVEHPYAVIATG